ncbi:uncharacterized protein LAESUDRAFT_728676 [Laetiporus sulphureus 93-53]|uniref:Uncharacterized protein n=1 Tax=Laetiporus sulphureus 93-53 TaxID=1314785 RepID=A0A165D1L3_9APHY|nr:uncharacterized protein LAESUDRAFT_728676 [Laetiporus sulphureus 93-53]KZT03965.1 hypothetical protein LAESUDRAFT_728676 [Laetiporus sulphureus 93-53]
MRFEAMLEKRWEAQHKIRLSRWRFILLSPGIPFFFGLVGRRIRWVWLKKDYSRQADKMASKKIGNRIGSLLLDGRCRTKVAPHTSVMQGGRE